MTKNFVAVDTSGNYLTVVAGKNGEFYSVSIPNCMMKHSVSVMPAVDEVLKKADMSSHVISTASSSLLKHRRRI